MGTRGFITFVIDGQEKTAYNHWDSYPDGLGADVLKWLRDALAKNADATTEAARKLRVVDDKSKPTQAEQALLAQYADPGVGSQKLDDWYVLLRRTQGNPGLMLEAGVIEDARDFPRDSLFAEWGYVADFDAKAFEVYEGFQKSRPAAGRFADREPDSSSHGYYPVALAKSWPFGELPTDEEFAAAFAGADE